MLQLYKTRLASTASRALGRLSEVDVSPVVLKPVIAAYARMFGVAMDDVIVPEGGFRRFSDFFVRRLHPAARPVSQDKGALISPCDGNVVEYGPLAGAAEVDFSVKGDRYSLNALLGREDAGDKFAGGGFMVIYLHPRDYHRVHVPIDGALTAIRQIPGLRYPVADWVTERVENVYQKNERVVFEMEMDSGASVSLVMVSAFGVGHIEIPFFTGWAKHTDTVREHSFPKAIDIERGDELGSFRLGSTVVMAWSKDAFTLGEDFVAGPTEFGRRIGKSEERES